MAGQCQFQAAAEGETSRIALLAEDDGTIGKIMVTTDAGQELLSEANTMVEVVSRFQPPSAQMQISSDQMYLHFGSSLSSLPIFRSFGTFASALIIINFAFVITWFPAVIGNPSYPQP